VVHGFASLVIDGAGLYPTIALRNAGLEDLLDFALRGLGMTLPRAAAAGGPKSRRAARA
jgi:hypothetical protein